MDFREIVEHHKDIVESIEQIQLTEEESISKLKAKLRLFDGTMLCVREVCKKNIVESYSYYWFRSDETLIIGWDNAPHHKNISSFPHHKHINNKIEASQEKNLEEVLVFIRDFLE